MIKSQKRVVASALAAFLAAAALSACNTVRGAGEDVQAGGAAVSGAATDVQQDMKNDTAH
ncbi:MAG: entericidin A/B family lipoprotein [Hyphomonadaceae bacterium]